MAVDGRIHGSDCSYGEHSGGAEIGHWNCECGFGVELGDICISTINIVSFLVLYY